jgi:hypothetical protein
MTTEKQNLPAVPTAANISTNNATAFSGPAGFESAQRMAMALVTSTMVPKDYQGKDNMGNALIALEMAQRVGASPMAVMQNLHIIHGRPSWSSSFIIAALNSCGRFSPLRFTVESEGDGKKCIAWAYDKATGDVLEGPESSIAMAKAEGWATKNGSKWKTMPDLMLRYRAAAFFGRLYAPDVLMGMHTDDEVQDIGERQAVAAVELAEPQTVEAVVEPLVEDPKPEKPKRTSRKKKPEPVAEPEPTTVTVEPEPPTLADPVTEEPEPVAEETTSEPTDKMDGDLF